MLVAQDQSGNFWPPFWPGHFPPHGPFAVSNRTIRESDRAFFSNHDDEAGSLWDGDKVVSDNEGVECADDKAACGAAAKALLELARDVVNGTASCELSVEVSDAQKKPLCRATLQLRSSG
jgi:hypothetical protein